MSVKNILDGLFNLIKLTDPTQQALAVEYVKIGWPVFPCDSSKAPMVDPVLGIMHGHKDAKTDLRLIAKTWHKYPGAAIGFAIPKDLIVFDCDVAKDAEKRPILRDGMPVQVGLGSLQNLILDSHIGEDDLDTLSVRTQSGGRQLFYRMPEGIPSFCHTHAMEGLDLKGYGGYVILPNSQGRYGKYQFLNLTEIRPIPGGLLKWILQLREVKTEFRKLPAGMANIDREEIVRILTPYWSEGDGRRNDLTMAIAGFIARSGGTEEDATFIISELARLTGKGLDHIPGSRYAFHREGPVKGFRSLEQLMEEIGNE